MMRIMLDFYIEMLKFFLTTIHHNFPVIFDCGFETMRVKACILKHFLAICIS